MSAPASTVNSYARSSGQPRRLVLDPWIIGTVCALLLIGLVMVASASIGISEKETGDAFHYFTRQLVYVALGLAGRLRRARRADAHLGRVFDVPARRRVPAAGRRAGARHRLRGQRRRGAGSASAS